MSLSAIIDATGAAVDAAVTVRASGELTSDVPTRIRAGEHSLTFDEPPVLRGESAAANPELRVLAAV